MLYDILIQGQKVVITLSGDFTVHLTGTMPKKIQALLNDGYADFTFDLEHSRYIDSHGISCLLSCVADKLNVTKKVVLINCHSFIKLLIEKCELSAWIEIPEES